MSAACGDVGAYREMRWLANAPGGGSLERLASRCPFQGQMLDSTASSETRRRHSMTAKQKLNRNRLRLLATPGFEPHLRNWCNPEWTIRKPQHTIKSLKAVCRRTNACLHMWWQIQTRCCKDKEDLAQVTNSCTSITHSLHKRIVLTRDLRQTSTTKR